MSKESAQPSIFLSHSHADKPFAQRLAQDLTGAGVHVWIDDAEMLPGDSLVDKIREGIDQMDYLGVILSPKSVSSEWVRIEVEIAMNQQIAGRQIKVLPLLYEKCDLPGFLTGKVYADFTTEEGYPGALRLLLKRLGADSGTPYHDGDPELLPSEWVVGEAREHGAFFAQIRRLHDIVQRYVTRLETDTGVIITLYAQSFPVRGIGKFEFDLIYYRNICDPAPMFGPLVKDDDRRKFAEGSKLIEIGRPSKPAKPGGFIEREGVESFAKFKLTPKMHLAGERDRDNEQSEIVGLLFINGRNFPIPSGIFDSPQFRATLSELERSVDEIRATRRQKSNEKISRVVGNLPSPIQGSVLPSAVDTFFKNVLNRLSFITGCHDLIFSAYLYSDGQTSRSERLVWLWSNSPTSTPATLPLLPKKTNDSLLIADVAIDPNNKPLLVHDVHKREKYKNRVIRTRLGDELHVDLVVPVLSNVNSRLLGVLDIQARDPQRFDTDDVQLIYLLSQFCLSEAMEKVYAAYDSGDLPLHNDKRYVPFNKQKLAFPVDDMLVLNFNPMKFLLHWDKIRELVDTDRTKSPASVEIWPNMICNHKCTWCRTANDRRVQERKKREMTETELRGIADDLQRLGAVDVLISGGGEPLLHAAIHEFMDLIADVDGTVGIFTNGTRPKDFRFWESFFRRTDRHRFVRVSFNGHDPESYCRIHFNDDRLDLSKHRRRYAEARKIVMDLLGMRSPTASIAIGDTVQFHEIQYVEQKAQHADDLGVDFIQMRPELYESSHFNDRGTAVCKSVLAVIPKYASREDYSVVHTDGERSFIEHDEPRCYAMHLVPTLVPDSEKGWTRVMPCSYAINRWGKVPDLGRMREGAQLSEFWKQMNRKLHGGTPRNPEFEVTIEQHIDPRNGCPQCRYYRLNKRIQSLVNSKDKIDLIDQLVDALNEDPESLDEALCERIRAVWENGTIDITMAKKAFEKSKQLNIVPSF